LYIDVVRHELSLLRWHLVKYCLSVGTVPTDAYEVAMLNGCDFHDTSQLVQVSQQQQQQLTVLYDNNILPIS